MGWLTVSSVIAFLELVISFAAVIMKKLTDSQGEQVSKRNEKLLTEWSLLNNLNWTQAGNDFSIITFGGYTLIAGAFLLSRLMGDKFQHERCEKILLLCGIIFFLTEACLVFGALEYVPTDIHVNALVLGSLSVVGAVLFFIDICYKSSQKTYLSKEVQTELQYIFPMEMPTTKLKSSIRTKSSFPTKVQIYESGCPVNLNSKLNKFQRCCETKNAFPKYLKTRVLQTDV